MHSPSHYFSRSLAILLYMYNVMDEMHNFGIRYRYVINSYETAVVSIYSRFNSSEAFCFTEVIALPPIPAFLYTKVRPHPRLEREQRYVSGVTPSCLNPVDSTVAEKGTVGAAVGKATVSLLQVRSDHFFDEHTMVKIRLFYSPALYRHVQLCQGWWYSRKGF